MAASTSEPVSAGNLDSLAWNEAGLLPVVAQDRHSGVVRMVAWANREALVATQETGEGTFFSRSRNALWKKGESSGNVLRVVEVWTDCDGDTLLYLVDATGPSCHLGHESCFFRRVDSNVVSPSVPYSEALAGEALARPTFAALENELHLRTQSDGSKSYTKHLLDAGAEKIGAKLREEAGELADAIASESDERVASEAGDVIYHLLVGLLHRGSSLRAVAAVLAGRFGVSGHDEKRARKS